jgi:anthranilate synthase component II
MSKKLLMLDNYDSFTFNLVHLLKEIGGREISVFRNDKVSLSEIAQFDEIVLSPGPGIPLEAGIMPELVKQYAGTKKILGICLGHQCIGEVFGATLVNLERPVHGVATECKIIDQSELIFNGVAPEIKVGRYHSWVVGRDKFPSCLKVTAEDNLGQIMALRHKEYNIAGLQFHPESILTPDGKTLVKNWLENPK